MAPKNGWHLIILILDFDLSESIDYIIGGDSRNEKTMRYVSCFDGFVFYHREIIGLLSPFNDWLIWNYMIGHSWGFAFDITVWLFCWKEILCLIEDDYFWTSSDPALVPITDSVRNQMPLFSFLLLHLLIVWGNITQCFSMEGNVKITWWG